MLWSVRNEKRELMDSILHMTVMLLRMSELCTKSHMVLLRRNPDIERGILESALCIHLYIFYITEFLCLYFEIVGFVHVRQSSFQDSEGDCPRRR